MRGRWLPVSIATGLAAAVSVVALTLMPEPAFADGCQTAISNFASETDTAGERLGSYLDWIKTTGAEVASRSAQSYGSLTSSGELEAIANEARARSASTRQSLVRSTAALQVIGQNGCGTKEDFATYADLVASLTDQYNQTKSTVFRSKPAGLGSEARYATVSFRGLVEAYTFSAPPYNASTDEEEAGLTDEEAKAKLEEGAAAERGKALDTDDVDSGTKVGKLTLPEPVQLEDPLRFDFEELIRKRIPDFLLLLLGIVAMTSFLINGFKYLGSASNSEATGQAKLGMLWAAVGVAVAFGAFLVLQLLQTRVFLE